jgi:carbonic anhydrase/acetyltransferase-like protein (isoleucine patch superfamily)
MVMLHGCSIGDGCLIGIKAVVMNGARIGNNCLLGAGCLVTEGKEIPERSLVLGAPGKVVRQLTDEEVQGVLRSARHYVALARRYLQTLQPQP